MSSEKSGKVRYAVIGAGNIAQVAILPAFEHARENSELVAIISHDQEKRETLGRQYGVEFLGEYRELESVLERSKADAVYIATPNTLHKEFAQRASAMKAHVLCEKPLATTVEDCEAIARACKQHQVKLMTAYRLHFEEATLRALELVRSKRIGQPRLFDSVFTHVVRRGDIRRDADVGGGAAYDLGVYCINAARNFFGAEPVSVFATANQNNGVDDLTLAILTFTEGRRAQFAVGNSLSSVSSYRITGTRGDLRVEPAYEYVEGLEHHLTIDDKTTTKSFSKRDQFAPELVYFSRCILQGTEPEPSADEATRDVRVVAAILRSIETGAVVELEPQPSRGGPDIDQELRKPAVKKPETLNAPSPSVR